MTPTLFQRLLGAEFYHLSPQVKALHSQSGQFVWRGLSTIERGNGLLARLACSVARLPPSMREVPVSVAFTCDNARETWQRSFNGVPMCSRLPFDAGRLHERLGLMSFRFRLYRIGADLHWVAEEAKFLGLIPLPAFWCEGMRCREFASDGRYCFMVEARLPWFGQLIHYQGWLMPDDGKPAD